MPSIVTSHPAISIWVSGILFALLHSVLAARSVKSRVQAAGVSPRAYRLAYTVVAVIAAALWLGFVRRLPDTPLYDLEGAGRWALHGVQLIGLWVFWMSLRPIDGRAFLGLKPFAGGVEPFTESGVYRYLRHPMYTGVMLIIFAMPTQTMNRLNLFLFIAAYFAAGSRLEEQRMAAEHPEYEDYRRRVPAFLPRTNGLRALITGRRTPKP